MSVENSEDKNNNRKISSTLSENEILKDLLQISLNYGMAQESLKLLKQMGDNLIYLGKMSDEEHQKLQDQIITFFENPADLSSISVSPLVSDEQQNQNQNISNISLDLNVLDLLF